MTIEMYITIGFSVLIILVLYLGFRIFRKIEILEFDIDTVIIENDKLIFTFNNHAEHIFSILSCINKGSKKIPYKKVVFLKRKKGTNELMRIDEITYGEILEKNKQ